MSSLRLPVLVFLFLVGCAPGGPPGSDNSAASSDTLRVLAYNIHHGAGMDEVLDLDRIGALIREADPDLVALQEIDSVTARTMGVDQARKLGELTGMHSAFGRFMAYDGGAYGMAVLSRWPMDEVENIRLPDGEEPRSALSVTVTLPASGRPLRFVGIHFYMTEEERLAQAKTLEEALSMDGVPTILAGDYNSEPDTAVMTWLGARWTILQKGDDHLSFPSYGPVKEIDFVLVRPDSEFRVLEHRLLDEPVASDHRPLFTELIVGE